MKLEHESRAFDDLRKQKWSLLWFSAGEWGVFESKGKRKGQLIGWGLDPQQAINDASLTFRRRKR